MTKVTYPSNSPYNLTPQSNWYTGQMVWRPIPPNSTDVLYTLLPRHQNRPDILSFDLYTTPAYYWVFCVRNPFLRDDLIWSFVTGLTIWVPAGDYLRRIVG